MRRHSASPLNFLGWDTPEMQQRRPDGERLPYGALQCRTIGQEVLFDRQYRLLASRSLDGRDPVVHAFDADARTALHRYQDDPDRSSARFYGGAVARSEYGRLRGILANFILGLPLEKVEWSDLSQDRLKDQEIDDLLS